MIAYRAAAPADAEAIAVLHADSWRLNYRGILPDAFLGGDILEDRRALWRARLGSPPAGQHVEVAESRGDVVAFICVQAHADPHFGALIDNVHVRREYLGRGIGTTLIAHAFAWLRATQAPTPVFLWVFEQNTAARRLYARLGGEEVEAVVRSTPGGGSASCRRCVWPSAEFL